MEGKALPVLACPLCRAPVSRRGEGWSCASCGGVFPERDGIPSLVGAEGDATARAFFDRIAGSSDDEAHNAGLVERQHRMMVSLFEGVISGLDPHGTLLDVGCGTGFFSARFGPGRLVVGVDFSLPMLAEARKRGLVPIHADATRLPFADGQFDVIVSSDAINQIEDVASVLSEMGRVAAPGGTVIVSCPNRGSLVRIFYRVYSRLTRVDRGGIRTFRRSAGDLIAAAPGCLRVREAFWTHLPTGLVTRRTEGFAAPRPLASNVVLVLEKTVR